MACPASPPWRRMGLLMTYLDLHHYDAARDELAVEDPYEVDFEPVFRHGPVMPPEFAALFAASRPVPSPDVAAVAARPFSSAGRPAANPEDLKS